MSSMAFRRSEENRAAPGTADEASGASAAERDIVPGIEAKTSLSGAENDSVVPPLAPPVCEADGMLGTEAPVVPACGETDGEPQPVSGASEGGAVADTKVSRRC
ncbi:unnamed protein product [Phytophthora fragariaefolia]|uniref:Unnamed protein product n=1 Tax=Phytophthora fragariaefolia TaxID=1490495 RepID=A0A9W6UBD0_9STRA|nr:unnamed protein product [Phytophthora fragariaefolia]